MRHLIRNPDGTPDMVCTSILRDILMLKPGEVVWCDEGKPWLSIYQYDTCEDPAVCIVSPKESRQHNTCQERTEVSA